MSCLVYLRSGVPTIQVSVYDLQKFQLDEKLYLCPLFCLSFFSHHFQIGIFLSKYMNNLRDWYLTIFLNLLFNLVYWEHEKLDHFQISLKWCFQFFFTITSQCITHGYLFEIFLLILNNELSKNVQNYIISPTK